MLHQRECFAFTANPPWQSAGVNAIADASGKFTGLFWTCDEFPPATTLEGGTGAGTRCTPHKRTYEYKSVGICTPTGPYEPEQDWQAHAHNSLRLHLCSDAYADEGQYLFIFASNITPRLQLELPQSFIMSAQCRRPSRMAPFGKTRSS